MYHSKVVVICWAAVYLAATVAGLCKRRWEGVTHVLSGAVLVAAGVGLSAAVDHAVGALFLSAALLVAAYLTLKGIIQILGK